MEKQHLLLFAAAAIVRLVLFTAFPSLSNTLAGQVEISTPVTSFKRCKYLMGAKDSMTLLTILTSARGSFSSYP